MHSPDKRWWTVRAGEYVLGTLRGRDLELFEKILHHDTDMQHEVAEWERRLSVLNEDLPEVQPSAHVLPQILERIHRLESNTAPPTSSGSRGSLELDVAPVESDLDDRVRGSGMWPAIAGLASAACLVLAVMLYQLTAESHTPAFFTDGVAVVAGDDSGSLYYLVETDYSSHKVRVTALAPPAIDTGRNYQLWQALPDRSAVRPVALLPTSSGTSRIYDVDTLIPGSDLFGVSVEAIGASLENGPQGPVVAHGEYRQTSDAD